MTIMHIEGKPGSAPRGAIARLAFTLAEHARTCGLRLVKLSSSRSRHGSCYMTLADGAGRVWRLRVSDHRPAKIRTVPDDHFCLVSRDGVAGLDGAKRFIEQIAAGAIGWRDMDAAFRMPKPRKRGHKERAS